MESCSAARHWLQRTADSGFHARTKGISWLRATQFGAGTRIILYRQKADKRFLGGFSFNLSVQGMLN